MIEGHIGDDRASVEVYAFTDGDEFAGDFAAAYAKVMNLTLT